MEVAPSGPSQVFGFVSLKSFVEAVWGKHTSKQPKGRVEEEEVYKSFFFNSSEEELKNIEKAMVGITIAPGLAFGVRQSLLEEGIFFNTSNSFSP